MYVYVCMSSNPEDKSENRLPDSSTSSSSFSHHHFPMSPMKMVRNSGYTPVSENPNGSSSRGIGDESLAVTFYMVQTLVFNGLQTKIVDNYGCSSAIACNGFMVLEILIRSLICLLQRQATRETLWQGAGMGDWLMVNHLCLSWSFVWIWQNRIYVNTQCPKLDGFSRTLKKCQTHRVVLFPIFVGHPLNGILWSRQSKPLNFGPSNAKRSN